MRLRPPVILGYHGIDDVDPRHDPIRLFVDPQRFRRQVRSLQRWGYRFVSMTELGQRLNGGEPPASALAALTFDDGTSDHAEVLPGLLAELEVPGTIYVCPELLGEPYPWSDPAAGRRFMSADQLRETAARPWIEIGAHTNRHTVLGEATYELAHREMSQCKATIEGMLGVEVNSFCYPRCFYTPACLEAAEAAGYTTAVTCGPRGGWGRYELARPVVHTPDGPLTFALKARGLHGPLRSTAPARALREITRPFRHRAERG